MAAFDNAAFGDGAATFYYNPSHWSAFDGVSSLLKAHAGGIAVLTGPTGSGKTALSRAIIDSMDDSVQAVTLQYASLNFREFIDFLHSALSVELEIDDANHGLALKKYLGLLADRGEGAVVFIDDAQNLTAEVLAAAPRLARVGETFAGAPYGLSIVMVGDAHLRAKIDAHPDADAIQDVIVTDQELRFFNRAEVDSFLNRRLRPIVRLGAADPIEPEAVNKVALYTGGSPRLITKICGHAMLFAAENAGKPISEKMIDEAADALMMEPQPDAFQDDDELDPTAPFSGGGAFSGTSADAWRQASAYLRDEERRRDPGLLRRLWAKATLRGAKTVGAAAEKRQEQTPARRRRHVRARAPGAFRDLVRKLGVAVLAVVVISAGWVALRVAPWETLWAQASSAVGAAATAVTVDAPRPPTDAAASVEAAPTPPQRQPDAANDDGVVYAARDVIDTLDAALGSQTNNGAAGRILGAASGALGELRGDLLRVGANQEERSIKADAFVQEAEAHFTAERYTQPFRRNAYHYYRLALELQPDHPEAVAGVLKLVELYDGFAKEAQGRGRWSAATRYYETLNRMRSLRPAR